LFRQPSGSDEGADAITLRGSQKRLRAENDPIASGLPRIARRGRPFLSEQPDDNLFCYYKGDGVEQPTKSPHKLDCAWDVACWHEPDHPVRSDHVRCSGRTGSGWQMDRKDPHWGRRKLARDL
jgi:hypothetical protein